MKFKYFITWFALWAFLRIVADITFGVYCTLAGLTCDSLPHAYRFVLIAISVIIICIGYFVEKRWLVTLATESGHSLESVIYARHKMYMSDQRILDAWDLADRITVHKERQSKK